MLTTLLPGVEVPSGDDTLCEALKRVCGSPSLRSEFLRIGLVNPQGRLYRLILAQDLAEFDTVRAYLKAQRWKDHHAIPGMDAVMGLR